MTTEQHLDAARRAGYIADIRLCQAVSDHPMDNDQWECADTAYAWSIIAAHHGRAAQFCYGCRGAGIVETFTTYYCKLCSGYGWTPRAII